MGRAAFSNIEIFPVIRVFVGNRLMALPLGVRELSALPWLLLP